MEYAHNAYDKWGNLVGHRALDTLSSLCAPYVFQVRKADVLDLPKKSYERRTFSMTPDQQAWYRQAKLEILPRVWSDSSSCTVVFELFTALQQIRSGFWNRRHSDGAGERRLRKLKIVSPIDNPLCRAARKFVGEIPADEQTVIFCKYHEEVRDLHHILDDTRIFAGCISEGRARRNLREWQKGNARVLITTMSMGARGQNWQHTCSSVLFYSNSFQFSSRCHAEDRIHRKGQTRPCHYVDLYMQCGIDEKIRQNNLRKADMVMKFSSRDMLHAYLME